MTTAASDYQPLWPAPLVFLDELLRAAYASCPDDPVAAEVEQLHYRVHQAIHGDPVIKSVESRYPALTLLHRSPTIAATASATLADLDAFREQAAGDPLLRDVQDVFDQRANRVAERILRDFTESDECARACTTIMARRMTPDRAKGLAEKGGQQLVAVLAADGVSVFRLEAMARLDAAFTSQQFERTREAIQIVIDALLSDVPEPMERQILRALLEDLRDASDLTQSKERLRWIVETLLKPGNGQILETVLDRVLDALQRDEHREALTRGVAIYAEILFRAVLEYWRGTYVDPDDPSLLSVKEGAAYLGIRPYSLHTHIRRRANTASEVPARLTTAVGGRKTYVLPLAELKVWEQTHWRPGRRAPRGPA